MAPLQHGTTAGKWVCLAALDKLLQFWDWPLGATAVHHRTCHISCFRSVSTTVAPHVVACRTAREVVSWYRREWWWREVRWRKWRWWQRRWWHWWARGWWAWRHLPEWWQKWWHQQQHWSIVALMSLMSLGMIVGSWGPHWAGHLRLLVDLRMHHGWIDIHRILHLRHTVCHVGEADRSNPG